ncbi:MAG: hypothetical protein HOV97_29730 [Nonomuraea sp.]|nr:hypothetical protein [Nonomuraea sp.]
MSTAAVVFDCLSTVKTHVSGLPIGLGARTRVRGASRLRVRMCQNGVIAARGGYWRQ